MKLQLAAAFGASLLIARQFTFDSYRGQIVVITGGSRGLGFALASDLVSRGARVILLARDSKELRAACDKLGADAFAITCDVTSKAQLSRAIDKVIRDFGRIDTFIHNAGLISVGPFDSFTENDFDNAINLHLKTAIYSVQLLKTVLKPTSRIVFICSVGGRVGLPHMSAYTSTKFAMSGFADAVRPELASKGISLTVAYPGLMRTGSPVQATIKGNVQGEFLWFAAADHLPFFSLAADRAARRILRAALLRRSEIIVGWSAKMLTIMRTLMPEFTALSMRAANAMLPTSTKARGVKGREARATFDKVAGPLKGREKKARAKWNQNTPAPV